MKKVVTYILFALALTSFLMMTEGAMAQNNAYKINDRLYDYFEKCNGLRKFDKVLPMCDTLFVMAGNLHDSKAQCLSLFLKGSHYCLKMDTVNIDKMLIKLSRYSYKQYYYGLWLSKINLFLVSKDFSRAAKELEIYQKSALADNNDYALSKYYEALGNMYYIQMRYQLAMDTYREGLDFMKRHQMNNEVSSAYISIAYVYFLMDDYDNAISYYSKSLNLLLSEARYDALGTCYVMLANNYYAKNDMEKGLYYFNKYNEWEKKYPGIYRSNSLKYHMLATYYLSTHEYDKAALYCDSARGMIHALQVKATAYEKKGDFENAYNIFCQYVDEYSYRTTNYHNDILAKYSAKFENKKLETEKKEIQMKASRGLVRQLGTEKHLMMVDRDRKLLVIYNSQLQLRNKNLLFKNQQVAMSKQKVETQREHDKAVNQEQMNKRDKHLYILWICILVFIILFALLYLALSIRSHRKLKREIVIANNAQSEAEVAQHQAVVADEQKSRFLQDVSHEIRTPLNAIVGFTDLLTDPNMELSDEDKNSFSKLISSNSEFLRTLVNDVLDLSKLEAGTYRLHFSYVALNQFCALLIDTLQGTQNEGVEMRFEAPKDEVSLYTDEERTRQVLVNFLTNACKYTEKGSIVLTYQLENEEVVFSVTDTGCGIKTENAEKIFDRFEKLGSFEKGTGIGLNICRYIAPLLHGKVLLDSAYTDGARFCFIHPLSQPKSV